MVLSVDPVYRGGKRGRTVGERGSGRLGSVRIARNTTASQDNELKFLGGPFVQKVEEGRNSNAEAPPRYAAVRSPLHQWRDLTHNPVVLQWSGVEAGRNFGPPGKFKQLRPRELAEQLADKCFRVLGEHRTHSRPCKTPSSNDQIAIQKRDMSCLA